MAVPVESVTSLNVDTPSTSKVLLRVVAPSTSKVLLRVVASSTFKVPSTSVLPPTFKFLTIPTPPSTFNAPVVLLVDSVVLSISTSPVISALPATERLVLLSNCKPVSYTHLTLPTSDLV